MADEQQPQAMTVFGGSTTTSTGAIIPKITLTPAQVSERDAYLHRRYGITEADYIKMGDAQSWQCAICKTAVAPDGTDLRVDHNHKTGVVRGLLCNMCNTGIGLMDDSAIRLAEAIIYLTQHGDAGDGY